MNHAFPEDELRPISCTPLTRDRENPAHIDLNDPLGNYSLTLVDSLSTLAIFAADSVKALQTFHYAVQLLVDLYGSSGKRARGFDLDSKVQVFETVIRGVGGLLSAHQFAVGQLPLPRIDESTYGGELLHLAEDLAKRLLPAFNSTTGIPYPRVNLRYGIPFYPNSPLNHDSMYGQCPSDNATNPEITETCSAGAGSLVLEFTLLSKLTGNPIYEQVAQRAFWAVWDERSNLNLVGAGISAETGEWVSSYTGIGAGIDSFYEYAAKASVFLGSADFGRVWAQSRAAIQRHLFRRQPYPHYIQADLFTGALRAPWMDSLSAFYAGTLVLMGHVEEAIEMHLMTTALWTRYNGLPERWSALEGEVEMGLGWWGGRPEFIESTYYLYQATRDPFYLYVGSMILKDIQRRCWTPCGWAGLQDVRTGEQSDRMQSFFLGETAKYLYLLFHVDHPLNKWDGPFVFSTEGHPLLNIVQERSELSNQTCPVAVTHLGSGIASRKDLFHAAYLARWPKKYPWTLPQSLIRGTSAPIEHVRTFEIVFASVPSTVVAPNSILRVPSGLLVTSISGLRFTLAQDHMCDSGRCVHRVQAVNHIGLGHDEQVFLAKDTLAGVVSPQDPNFRRVENVERFDLVMDVKPNTTSTYFSDTLNSEQKQMQAAQSTGYGAAKIPSTGDADTKLPWDRIYVAGFGCGSDLPAAVPLYHQIIVFRRGHCGFGQKLERIPSFPSTRFSLQLVLVVSDLEDDFVPMLPDIQHDSAGNVRPQPIPLAAIHGGETMWRMWKERILAVGIRRRYHIEAQGVPIGNLIIL